jgi:hypothetical protein
MAAFKPQSDLAAKFPTHRKLVFQQNRPNPDVQVTEMIDTKQTAGNWSFNGGIEHGQPGSRV